MPPIIRGKAFELLVKRLLMSCNFTEVTPDGIFVYNGTPGTMIQELGQPHNADVLVEPPFLTPFYFPSRLLVECKCYKRAVDLSIVRGVLGLLEDGVILFLLRCESPLHTAIIMTIVMMGMLCTGTTRGNFGIS